MRLLRFVAFSIVLMLISTPGALAQQLRSDSTATEQSALDSFDESAEKQMVELLQADRQKAGVALLEWNMNLRDTKSGIRACVVDLGRRLQNRLRFQPGATTLPDECLYF